VINILLPAYNEEKALGSVIAGIVRALPGGGFRIWVVDDGSSDGTAEVARKCGAAGAPVVLLRHEVNRGLGQAFRTGLTAVLPVLADSDILVTMDSDDTHPPSLIPDLVRPIEEGRADLAIASRFAPGGREVGVPLIRRVLSAGARIVFRAFFPIAGVKDYTCAYRAVLGKVVRQGVERWGNLVTEDGFASSVEMLLRLAAGRPRIVELPLVLRYDRKSGPSKMRVFATVRRTLAVLARLRRIRPPRV
jgi:dolichol-phosphate mannosyltransferase